MTDEIEISYFVLKLQSHIIRYKSSAFDSNRSSAKLGQTLFQPKQFPMLVFTSINSADDEIQIFWIENVSVLNVQDQISKMTVL